MKKYIASIALAVLPALAYAQTALDGYNLSQSDLRGTARFMSMAGAFGALGGDLSTLNQNPGGIGIYRKSEVGVTLNIDMQNSKSISSGFSETDSQTKVYCPNFGYIGSMSTGSQVMPYFNWGASYGRVASFDRRYKGSSDMFGSLSNYVAGYTTVEGYASAGEGSLALKDNPDAYWQGMPWMSILAFNSYMINPTGGTSQYNGLWQNDTRGVSSFEVEERGHIDEYSINFGGNISNIVYWGLGFGINDISFTQNVYYTEDMTKACIPASDGQGIAPAPGDGGFGLNSFKRITGTGYNVKFGLIARPINELRIGFAVHTPTYYSLTHRINAEVDYGYGYTTGAVAPDYCGTPTDTYEWNFRSPWRLMVSAAGIIGNKAIISADYEYRPYQSMNFKNVGSYQGEKDLNGDVKTYYQAANILRLGAEYRINNSFSVRAGYSVETAPTTTAVRENRTMVFTSNPGDTGVTPSYSLDNTTQYFTLGIGFHYKKFYADAAYVHKNRSTEFHSFTNRNDLNTADSNYPGADPYTSKVTLNSNNLVFSVGFKF